jgi:methylglutaconyl-CoA hydratase
MAVLEISRAGAVVTVTINRPDVRNALDEAVISELTAWAVSAASGGARVAILQGAGKVFCAGADQAWMAKMAGFSDEENLADARRAAGLFYALDTLPLPLIGRIHGAALGGGVGLAAVCDIVVAEDGAVFGLTEAKLGILPAMISPFVLAKIGRSAARELFLTAARFSAQRAREIGLVHAVVPAAELDSTVAAYVAELLTSAPEAVATAKRLIASVAGRPPAEVADLTAATIAARRASEEGLEGMRAFFETRKPAWAARSDA